MKTISRQEAFDLMSKDDLAYLDKKVKELEGIVKNKKSFIFDFYLDNGKNELFVEICSSEENVLYRLMFHIKREKGRPVIGKTKKVSLTLPDKTWEQIEEFKAEWETSMSETFRVILDEYFNEQSGRVK